VSNTYPEWEGVFSMLFCKEREGISDSVGQIFPVVGKKVGPQSKCFPPTSKTGGTLAQHRFSGDFCDPKSREKFHRHNFQFAFAENFFLPRLHRLD